MHQTVANQPGVPFQERSTVWWCSKTFFFKPFLNFVKFYLNSDVPPLIATEEINHSLTQRYNFKDKVQPINHRVSLQSEYLTYGRRT